MKNSFLILVLIVILSCDSNLTYSGLTQFIYQNNSNKKIQLLAYINGEISSQYTLKPNEEFKYTDGLREGENNPPYNSPNYIFDDSVVTIFNDSVSIMYDNGRLEGNPMRIENYELIEGETEPYRYLFEFTEKDYQRALDRGRVIK